MISLDLSNSFVITVSQLIWLNHRGEGEAYSILVLNSLVDQSHNCLFSIRDSYSLPKLTETD